VDNELGQACDIQGKNEKFMTEFWCGNPEEKYILEK
jgi:hypothetical protein